MSLLITGLLGPSCKLYTALNMEPKVIGLAQMMFLFEQLMFRFYLKFPGCSTHHGTREKKATILVDGLQPVPTMYIYIYMFIIGKGNYNISLQYKKYNNLPNVPNSMSKSLQKAYPNFDLTMS